jgi:hypothetical protein
VTVSTPGLHRVCTLDTGVKGRKSENMADYITLYPVVCLPFFLLSVGYMCKGVRWTQGTKGRKSDNVADYDSKNVCACSLTEPFLLSGLPPHTHTGRFGFGSVQNARW